MEQLLAACACLRATEPKDYVYGLLGIHQRGQGTIDQLLMPDYSRPMQDVFRDATRYLLEIRDYTRTWLWVYSDDDAQLLHPNRTSWAIDWSHLRVAESMSLHLRGFNAGCQGALAPALRFAEADEDVVFVKGLAHDKVVDTTSTLQVRSEMAWLEECFVKVRAGCSANETEALLSTVLTAFDKGRSVPLDQRLQACAAFSRTVSFTHELFSDTATCNDSDQSTVLAQKFFEAWIRTCSNHRLCTMSDGRVGIGPPIATTGDIVAVFRGFHAPYVLRPIG